MKRGSSTSKSKCHTNLQKHIEVKVPLFKLQRFTPTSNQPQVPQAWIYFVLYQMFVSALLFELLTAIVLDAFSAEEDDNQIIPEAFISNYTDTWVKHGTNECFNGKGSNLFSESSARVNKQNSKAKNVQGQTQTFCITEFPTLCLRSSMIRRRTR